MIDTHCHLTDPRLGAQLEAMLLRARAAGVGRMITVATTLDIGDAAIALCAGRAFLRCVVGVHPHHAKEISTTDGAWVERLRAQQRDPSVVALGEMGLDYHYDFSERAQQATIFAAQMQLAAELGRPVVIHCREAVEDCLAIMRDFPDVRADFHCFTGTETEARRILDAGYLLGFTGVVTFKKSDELRRVVKRTPMDRLLVETDAPYLAPEPFRRQKVNEPALVMHTAAAVAAIKGVSVEELDRATTRNAQMFFGWM